MSKFPLAVPFALALALPGLAQTFVVDVNLGPGFDFQQIRGAIAQVPDGATLLVRSGTYAAFAIDGKGLTILAEPGATVTVTGAAGGISSVRNTAASQRTVIRGLRFDWQFTFDNCAGPILVEDVTMVAGQFHLDPATGLLFAFGCDQLFARGVQNDATTSVFDSAAVFEDCALNGLDAHTDPGSQHAGAPSLYVSGASVTLVDCALQGGAGLLLAPNQALPPSPGITSSGGQLRLLGATVVAAGAPNGTATVPALGRKYAVAAPIPVALDPQVQLVTAHPSVADPEFQLAVRPLPHVTGQSAGTGATLTASAPGPIGQFVILVVGLPGAPITLPGIDNAFWLDPTVSAWAAVGVPQTGAPLLGSATIPNHPSFRGLMVGWQSLTQGPNGLEASNPAWTLVR
ncbi:MAG: hypothetical protein KDE27_22700 [Planctomycetes bacterium]|nr:hypothetical protein [Planctomycetota bacterium]